MSIQGIGNSGASQATPQSSQSTAQSNSDIITSFLNYMKESPAQRMEDSWLAAHHLTRQELAAMPPSKRDAILKEMAADLKQEMMQQTENNLGKKAILSE